MATPLATFLGELSSPTRIVVWGTVLTLFLLAAWPVMVWLQRRFRSPKGTDVREPFTVEKVEQMYRHGLISDEEFSRLRRIALGLPEKNDKTGLNETPRDVDDRGGGVVGGDGPPRRT